MRIRILCGLSLFSVMLAGCTTGEMGSGLPGVSSAVPTERPGTETASASSATHGKLDRLISTYSAAYDVPASLVHRVVKRESNYNPQAYHAGNYGLMQIRYRTAKGMGYEGSPHGLLNAETNLKYAVKYLKGAWLVAGGSESRADRLYQTGYYYDAKRKGLLDKVGWEALAAVRPKSGAEDAVAAVAAATTPKAGPTVAVEAQPAETAEAPTMTASAEPVSSRFGKAPGGATTVASNSAPATAMGYTGSVPTAAQTLPGVMRAPAARP